MLKELHIENIAVIEKTDIKFDNGLNILTGETGAGKSIIIDSIGAVLGDRISHNLVRHGAEKAMVTAVFSNDNAEDWLAENEIDAEDELIIQRRITADGKSGCRINGIPASAAQLKSLGALLIDVHGQNDGIKLLDERRHIGYLDSFAGTNALRQSFSACYKDYLTIKEKLSELQLDEDEKQRSVDMLTFRIGELEAADVKQGEKDEISQRLAILRNFEKLSENVERAYESLYGSDDNAVNLTENTVYYLQRAADYSEKLAQIAETLNDCAINLSDAAQELRAFKDDMDFSEEAYNSLEERLSVISRLERKYSMPSDDFAAYLEEMHAKLSEFENSDELRDRLLKQQQEAINACRSEAEKLSKARKAAAKELERKITAELSALNMPSARFLVEIEKLSGGLGFDSTGCDRVRFIMSANSGEVPDRISKIASGGELSRIMLALKNIFAANDSVPVMIFDEIDTGVSGITAQKVGEKLFSVSVGKQVLCITHLPQIAAMADSHYLIEKTEKNGRTYTEVSSLDTNGRMAELARLYGGATVTDITLASAKEQLAAAKEMKKKFIELEK